MKLKGNPTDLITFLMGDKLIVIIKRKLNSDYLTFDSLIAKIVKSKITLLMFRSIDELENAEIDELIDEHTVIIVEK